MIDLLLRDANVVLTNGIARGSVPIEKGRIGDFIPAGESEPPASESIDLAGASVVSGLVDLHIHGSDGVDVQSASREDLERLALWLGRNGTTRYLPTFVPDSLDALGGASARVADAMRTSAPGAVPIGVHYEGPFVSHARCGALHREHFLDEARAAEFFEMVERVDFPSTAAKLITIAPEIPGGLEIIEEAVKRGFVVSIGHTDADAETLDAALERGARHVTHLANAMRPLHHREPGPAGWALLRSRVTADVIADLEHLHPDMLRIIFQMKTSHRVALISDAIAPTGQGDGVYEVWGETIRVDNGRTANGSGTIAGSVISLFDAVSNCVAMDVPLVDVARMASTVPARILGVPDIGSISTGNRADLVVFGTERRPARTFVDGIEVPSAD